MELLNADDALDTHVLSNLDSVGAPRRNHLTTRSDEMAFHRVFFDSFGITEKPCEFGNGFP